MDRSGALPGFAKLNQLARTPVEGGVRLAVAGDCATQHIAAALRGYGVYTDFPMQVFDADYDQVRAQLTDPDSELYGFDPAFLLLVFSVERLWADYCACEQREQFAEQKLAEIELYWNAFHDRLPGAKLLQCNYPELDDRVFGNFALKVRSSFLYQLRLLNLRLCDLAMAHPGVFLIDLCALQSRVGRNQFFNSKIYYVGKLPIHTNCLPLVAKEVLDVIHAVRGEIKKVAVLDLDNTLWGGVIGDDGLAGIQIGELGLGHAFTEFQAWLKELKKRGVLLAVCSKNTESTAREPFEKHPEMVLRMEDFSIFVANWEDKAGNIRMIRDTLNLGMDSFVFIDDNPFERELVRSLVPGITVPELPDDPAEYVKYLRELNLFETASYSEADASRTAQYQQEVGRVQAQRQAGSFDDYLQSLDMTAQAKPFDSFHYPRIAQLTQRSNQFNLRTVRYTEDEIRAAAEDPDALTLYFTLKDKFGDYGLISVVIGRKQDDRTLFVDTWLMSCRVLKRGMEEFIINTLVKTAAEQGFTTIRAEYLPTAKNAMVKDIYETLGFTALGDGQFVCDTRSFRENKTRIKMED